jgi:hypothetical protein
MAMARLKITMFYDLDEDREYRSKTPRGRFNSDRRAFGEGEITLKELVSRAVADHREVKWRLFTDEQYDVFEEKAPKPKGAVTKKAAKPAAKKKDALDEKPVVATKKKSQPAPLPAKKKLFSFRIKR